jgi:hypothetical protein
MWSSERLPGRLEAVEKFADHLERENANSCGATLGQHWNGTRLERGRLTT